MSEDLKLAPFDAAHQESWALLPWYRNDTLNAQEKAHVEQHLRGCLVCRREAELLGVLAAHTVAPRAGVECEAALRRLSQRLDRAPTRPRQFPWAAAAMIAVCTSLLSWAADNAESSTAWLRNAGYSMVAEHVPQDAMREPIGPQVNLVFYDDITERELRSLVLAIGAVVVEGPTPQGVYTLAFARQMSPGEVLDALRKLRYSRGVLFAEPATTRKVSTLAEW